PLPLAGEGRGEGRRAHQLKGESARVMFAKVFGIDARRMDDSRDWLSRSHHEARVRARTLRRASTDAERALWYRLRDRRDARRTAAMNAFGFHVMRFRLTLTPTP